MPSSFWADKLAGSQPPPHVPQPAAPAGAWWMTPVHPTAQSAAPPQGVQAPDSAVLGYQQLKGMRADQMTQDQMEALATLELQFDKYNQSCDQCGSTNYVPAGVKLGNFRMPTAKCFECGNSSGALTGSPEPALGGGGKPGRATRQLNGSSGSYGQHHSQLPQQFIPRGGQ